MVSERCQSATVLRPVSRQEVKMHGDGMLRVRGEKWYGQWWSSGTRVARVLGPVRKPGTREGLTRTQAQKRLREVRDATTPTAHVAEAKSIAEVGREYLVHLERAGRKLATRTAVESTLRVHLE